MVHLPDRPATRPAGTALLMHRHCLVHCLSGWAADSLPGEPLSQFKLSSCSDEVVRLDTPSRRQSGRHDQTNEYRREDRFHDQRRRRDPIPGFNWVSVVVSQTVWASVKTVCAGRKRRTALLLEVTEHATHQTSHTRPTFLSLSLLG